METWSSCEALVDTESMLAGVARTRISDSASAAVTWAIISPERVPGRVVRNAGSADRSGLSRRSIRRSQMDAMSAAAMATRSRHWATICAWKLPPLRTMPACGPRAPVSASGASEPLAPPSTRGLSVVELASVVRIRRA